MKGIILAGGNGTRLYPITKAISKHLIPIHDKPMIYYPLSVLMLNGIRDILIITTPNDYDQYRRLLGDGRQLGCHFEYAVQEKPDGIAQAFILGEKFIGEDRIALILGDNLFYGANLSEHFETFATNDGAYVFAYQVKDPERYGIVELNADQKATSIEEKPVYPKSNYAITGLYLYDYHVIDIAKTLKASHRGEYEITDINKIYLEKNKLSVAILEQSTVWMDMGTLDSFYDASQFVRRVEAERGEKIGCIEEIALRMNYIDLERFKLLVKPLMNSSYGQYLYRISNK